MAVGAGEVRRKLVSHDEQDGELAHEPRRYRRRRPATRSAIADPCVCTLQLSN